MSNSTTYFRSVATDAQTCSEAGLSTTENVHGTFGRHVIADLSACDTQRLSDPIYIQRIMEEGVQRAGATVIASRFHRFSPTGVSGIILLSESHASIHTWPEEGYASMDVYTCGDDVFPQIAFEHIAQQLNAKVTHTTMIERGLQDSQQYSSNANSDSNISEQPYVHHICHNGTAFRQHQ